MDATSVRFTMQKERMSVGVLQSKIEVEAADAKWTKAFKQMEKPVHEAINDMIVRMMAEHTDKLWIIA